MCISHSGMVSLLIFTFLCMVDRFATENVDYTPVLNVSLSCQYCGANLENRQVTWELTGITEFLPLWVAPNLITLVGTIGLLAAYVLYLIYLPALEGALSFPTPHQLSIISKCFVQQHSAVK